MLILMLLWHDNSFQLVLLWVPTQGTLSKSNKVKWCKLKKMAEEQQLGDYNLHKKSTSSKEKHPEQKSWTPQSAPEMGHKKCKAKSLCQRPVTRTCTNIIILDRPNQLIYMPRLWFCIAVILLFIQSLKRMQSISLTVWPFCHICCLFSAWKINI